MATSLSELRKSKGSLENLQKEVEKLASKGSGSSDDRFWKPTVDSAGNGSAVIRFLPAPKGEDVPWVRIWSHGFKGPTGKWYMENSLTTIGQDDPVGALNQKLWATGLDSDKQIARDQKRKLSYYANIYVVSDPKNPENEGKVFLYKFGTKIFDKIKDAMNPEFEDEEALNPFDFWEGANFKLKIREVEGWSNYDKSEFAKPSEIADDDAEIEKIWDACHSLSAMVDPKNFKSYEDLQTKLIAVLGTAAAGPGAVKAAAKLDEEDEAPAPSAAKNKAPVMKQEEDDDSSYFASLAEDD